MGLEGKKEVATKCTRDRLGVESANEMMIDVNDEKLVKKGQGHVKRVS